MHYDNLVRNKNIEEYKHIFYDIYCQSPIQTFDNINVIFKKNDFEHAFYESSNRKGNKDIFSHKRAERICWIKLILQDPKAELYIGWDNKSKTYNKNKRVALLAAGFVVIIRIIGFKKARFVTAYIPGRQPIGTQKESTYNQIRKGPRWE